MRLKRAGKTKQAITALQAARSDPKRKALVLLELGECFQKIEQYKLALSHYEQSIEACEAGDDGGPQTGPLPGRRAGHGPAGARPGRAAFVRIGRAGLWLSGRLRPAGQNRLVTR